MQQNFVILKKNIFNCVKNPNFAGSFENLTIHPIHFGLRNVDFGLRNSLIINEFYNQQAAIY